MSSVAFYLALLEILKEVNFLAEIETSSNITGAPRLDGPPSGAPYQYRKAKETHKLIFLLVIMANGIARGRVRTNR